jgi:type VI protein secretion system component Hcp
MADKQWFLKLDDLSGDVTHPCYQGWIELISWNIAPKGPGGGSSGSGAGRAAPVQEIVVTVPAGPWTSTLMNASSTGRPFKKAVIHGLVGGRTLHRTEFHNITVAGFHAAGTDEENRLLMSFELAFGALNFGESTTPKQPTRQMWDLSLARGA